jgi:hypothetical protein
MDTITANYFARAEIMLFMTTIIYFIMNGAQIFETAVIVPKWTRYPPESFQMFKGRDGLDFKAFWITMHSIHEITFILAIIFCWKLDIIRNWLLILFVVHFAVRAWTLFYFAPEIILFQKIANSTNKDGDLIHRTMRWRNLNYIRAGLFIAISIGLIPLCIMLVNLTFDTMH